MRGRARSPLAVAAAALVLAAPASARPPEQRRALALALDEEEHLLGRAVGAGDWTARLAGLGDEELDRGWHELLRRRSCGRLDPAPVQPGWHLPRPPCPSAGQGEARLAAAPSVSRALEATDEGRPGLGAATAALAGLVATVEQGGWPAVPPGPTLERGERGPRVEALRRRLAASGDLSSSRVGGTHLDAELERGVLRFQARHGLLEDGRVGPRTLAALNEPARRRLARLRANVERLRALPDWSRGEHLLVNVPAQELSAWSDGRRLLRMRVVVGTRRHRTPMFRERMTHLVFHPPWKVPPTLAARELLPQLRRDAEGFARKGYEVLDAAGRTVPLEELVLAGSEPAGWSGSAAAPRRPPLSAGALLRGEYRIRQQPGEANALGLVKFMFPNRFSVYLHDTPATSLFEAPSRAFSHGCIRVEQPVRLAEHVLAGNAPAWTREQVLRAMRSPTREVELQSPPVVTIVYLTAWVDPEDGTLHFRDDLYGLDAPWLEALSR